MSHLTFSLLFVTLTVGVGSVDAQTVGDGTPTGPYVCYATDGNSTPGTQPKGTGIFALLGNGTYRALPDSKVEGKYQYDPATRQITWLTGPHAERGITATYVGVGSRPWNFPRARPDYYSRQIALEVDGAKQRCYLTMRR
jgi:hypothetical protein